MARNDRQGWHRLPTQHATRNHQRMCFTHVGIICNKAEIQPLLPQVIFVAAHSLSIAAWERLLEDCPRNVFIKRMKKGWNNAAQHKIIIQILGLVLEPYLNTMQPILSFDAVPLHLENAIFDALRIAKIWYIVIPARLTWLLQPLDTHGFMKYKRFLKDTYQDNLAQGRGDEVERMIRLVMLAIRHVLQAIRWDYAFKENGFSSDLTNVSPYIREQLEWPNLPVISNERPSLEALRLCWPSNKPVQEGLAFGAFPPPEPAPLPALPAPDIADIILEPVLAIAAAPDVIYAAVIPPVQTGGAASSGDTGLPEEPDRPPLAGNSALPTGRLLRKTSMRPDSI